jgi:FtsZ-binding cell division protein ZapB
MAPPTLASLDAKMDTILRKMEEFTALQEKVVTLETTVTTMQATVTTMASTITTLQAEVSSLKEQANYREQQSKANAVRIFGLSTSDDDMEEGGKPLIKKIYDTIVKPVLVAAKSNRQLESVPTAHNVITEVIRLKQTSPQAIPGQQQSSLPPPLIVKFSSQHLKVAFMRNKRMNMPTPGESDRAAGVKRYSAMEDLTGPTYRLFKQMTASDLIEKVWTVDGKLRYTVPGDSTIRRVKSVYAEISSLIKS